MFDLFKKPQPKPPEVKEVPVQPSEIPHDPNKEIQLRDTKTGEFIYRKQLSKEHLKIIMDVFTKNAKCGQEWMGVCRKEVLVQQEKGNVYNGMLTSEKEISTAIEKIRDDLKLDRRWGFNFQLQCLERRDPPDA